jgi:hypothetical protein
MYNFYLKITILVACLSFTTYASFAQTTNLPPKLNKAIQEGNTKKAEEYCAETIFSTESLAEGARANTIMSIILFLEMNPDAESRSASIREFLVDSEDPDEKNATLILSYISGKLSANKLAAAIKESDPNWQATAFAAIYVKYLKDSGVNPEQLNKCVKKYMSISENLESGSWGNTWKNRLITWHNSFQDPTSDTSDLEPLIVKVKEDLLNGPIKDQLATINEVIKELLKNHKIEATRAIKKAITELGSKKNKPENKAYLSILNYLDGKSTKTKDLYQATIKDPELFLITSIAVFTKQLSTAKPGEIYKGAFIAYLKNFSKNIENSKQDLVTEWKPKVEKWEKWCSDDFPLSTSLAPLLALHSRAIAEKNKKALALKDALRLYEKIKFYKSFSQLSMKDYKKVRELFKNRPRPASMDFSTPDIKEYVQSLPMEIQQGEWRRIRYMQVFKKDLVENLNFSHYKGNIKMQKKTVKGKILKADSQYIVIQSKYGKKKYRWGDLKPEQYILFTESYIKNNIGGKVGGRTNVFSSKDATAKVLTKEYRKLAILCDWFGKYSDAIKYGKKADTYPQSKGATRQLLLQ